MSTEVGVSEARFNSQVRGERGRVTATGKRTDGAGDGTLLVIQEDNETWVFYPPIGECGVRLSAAEALGVAESILTHAAPG
jgi:hypothetical protein